jgi:hypothetical protein
MTALEVITRALRKLRVYAAGENITAADTEDCLEMLNLMLSGWSIDGIDLAPQDLLTTDTLDVPDDHLETIYLSLAERVGGDFGAELAPADALRAETGRASLRAYHFSIATIGIDHPAALPRLREGI